MEQIMGRLIAMREQITTQVVANMNAWRKETRANQEVMEAYPERAKSRIETGQEPMEAKIKTCLAEVGHRFGGKSRRNRV
jgi:hypothetical protein